MKISIILPLVIVSLASLGLIDKVQTSFWDSIPVISQLKSVFQVIGGDAEGAKKTQENFVKTAPVVSQITSAVQSAQGNNEAARETQKAFGKNLETVADSLPVIGHIKGGIHVAAGEREKGLDIIKGASSSTGALIGGLLGGPAGAVAGGAVVDGITTGIESAVNKEFTPSGVVEHVANIKDKSIGDHFDFGVGIGVDVYGSQKAKGKLNENKIKAVHDRGPSHDVEMGSRPRRPIEPKEKSPDPPELVFKEDRIHRDRPDGSQPLPNSAILDHQLHVVKRYLGPEYGDHLTRVDVADINDIRGTQNCWVCTAAADQRRTVTNFIETHFLNEPRNQFSAQASISKILAIYERAGYKFVENFIDGRTPDQTKTLIKQDLERNAQIKNLSPDRLPKNMMQVAVAYVYHEWNPKTSLSQVNGHVVMGKFWLDTKRNLMQLITDFQLEFGPARFKRSLDELGAVQIYIIKFRGDPLFTELEPMDTSSLFEGAFMREEHTKFLPPEAAKELNLYDFKHVNDLDGQHNCWTCTAAGAQGLTVKQFLEKYSIPVEKARIAANIDSILTVYKQLGDDVFKGSYEKVKDFIGSKLKKPNQIAQVALVYRLLNQEGGHVVLAKFWRDVSGSLRELYIDFEQNIGPRRFLITLPETDSEIHVINFQQVELLNEKSLLALARSLDEEILRNKCNKRVVGYVATWSKGSLEVKQAAMMTNLIVAFAEMNHDGSLAMPISTTIARQRILEVGIAKSILASKGVNLPVSIAIGGWDNSQHFSRLLSNEEGRKSFVATIVRFIEDNHFDGVDIDWEYPGTGGAIEGTKEDRANYVSFLRDLRLAFGPTKLISIAGAAGEEALRGFDLKEIVKYVDWIGVMSYDFNGAWNSKWGAFVGPNAPLYHGAPPGYSGKLNVDWAIKQYACKTQTPSKILLGLPFYGRYWDNTINGLSPADYPLFRKARPVANGNYGGSESFRTIKSRMFKADFGLELQFDKRSRSPWAIEHNKGFVLTYDDEQSISEKINYATGHNLGGIMVWSIDQDDESLTLSNQLRSICKQTSNDVNYKCNPIEDRRWWTWAENETYAGMCGKSAPLYKGFYAHCDPDDPGFSCCSDKGYCGSGSEFCDCTGCIDYSKNPEKLIAEPVKPSRQIQWHIGFDTIKPGQPRCGAGVESINGFQAICNPDDDLAHCCSPGGYCGSGKDFCGCAGCKDFKKINETDSKIKVKPASEVKWHIGFDKVKPGEPRCGKSAPPINGAEAICDPDSASPCCSKWGYCGVGDGFC